MDRFWKLNKELNKMFNYFFKLFLSHVRTQTIITDG